MSVEELIQLMRTCSTAQVRAELEELKKKENKGHASSSTTLFEIGWFYQRATKRPK